MIRIGVHIRALTGITGYLSLTVLSLILASPFPSNAKDLSEIPLLKGISPAMERDLRTNALITGYAELNGAWKSTFADIIKTGGKPGTVSLNLPGKSFQLRFTKFQKTRTDRWAGLGTIEGKNPGSFSMAFYQGILSLEITDGETHKTIKVNHHTGGGLQIIDVSDLKTPQCINDRKELPLKNRPKFENEPSLAPALAKTAADTPVVHLGLIWSKEAAVGAGGADVLLAEIDRQVLEFNDILEKCGVNVRWKLVYTGEAANSDTINPDNFYRYFIRVIDSTMSSDTMVSICKLNAIDNMTVIRESEMPGAVGKGYKGFAIVNRYSFLTDPTVIYHEWGHGMGGDHQREMSFWGSTPEKYNYGYIYTFPDGTGWRTLMAVTGFLPRIKYFSNPFVEYEGIPTGLPAGTVDLDGNSISADNVRYFNETGASSASNYNKPGFNVAVDRRYPSIPPGGYQEFILRYGNTSVQPITNIQMSASVPKKRNYSIISINHDGYIDEASERVRWSVEDLGPGQPGHATIGDSLFLTVKINAGETFLNSLGITGLADGDIYNADYVSFTPVDSSLALYHLEKGGGPISTFKIQYLDGNSTINLLDGTKGFNIYLINGLLIWKYRHPEQTSGTRETILLPSSVTRHECGYLQYIKKD